MRSDHEAPDDGPADAPDDVPWLDDSEQEAWRRVIGGSRRLLERLDAELKPHGLSHDDYGVLVYLSEAPDDRLRMSDLALVVAESRSRLSHHVGRMETKGLVRREACPEDRRGSWAVLTPAGRQLLETAAATHVRSVRTWFIDHLDRDQLAVIGEVFGAMDDRLLTGCADVADPSGCG